MRQAIVKPGGGGKMTSGSIPRRSFRRFLPLLAIGLAVSMLASCDPPPPGPAEAGAPPVEASARAKADGTAYRIVYLSPLAAGETSPFVQAFMDGLRDLNYEDGKNVRVDFKYAGGRDEAYPELVAEALEETPEPDVIVGSSSPAALAAKKATKDIPIVFVGVGDPVGVGLVDELCCPKENVTGVASFSPELSVKRLELLKEALPNASRVAVLWNSGNPVKRMDWSETEKAAAVSRLTLESLAVRSPAEFEAAFDAAVPSGSSGLVVLGDPLTVQRAPAIVRLAMRAGLPGIYEGAEFAECGGLLSYAANRAGYYRRAADYVDRILRGEKPANLPVERPSRFELVVKMWAAQILGVELPNSIMISADRIIHNEACA